MTFPLSGASVDLDFTTGQYYNSGGGSSLDSLLSISRASVGYAKNASGILMPFSSNLFRITDLGLLIEDARTNIILSSNDLRSVGEGDAVTAWVAQATTGTLSGTAPDGSSTATQITATAGTGDHERIQTVTTSAAKYSWSAFLKAGTASWALLEIDGSATNHAAYFNLTTGAVGTVETNSTATIDPYGNGWYRCSVVSTDNITTGAATLATVMPATADAQAVNWNAAGTETIFAWGAQLEQASFPSSYIPTTTTSATRAADAISCISSFNTILTNFPHSALLDLTLYSSTANFSRLIGSTPTTQTLMAVRTVNSAQMINSSSAGAHCIFPGGVTWPGGLKLAASQDTGVESIVAGGGTVVTGTTPQVMSSPLLGSGVGDSMPFCLIRRATAWNSKLADATLQALTLPGGDFYDLLNDTLSAVGRGTVAAGGSNLSIQTSAFMLGNVAASGVVSNQFVGRAVLFDGNTTTAGLQGATALITASTASNTPTFTLVTSLPATPVAGDTFSVV